MPADKTPYIANQGRHAPSSTEVPLVAVGVITGAHGIRGQVKIRCFTADPYVLSDYTLLNETGSKRYELRIDAETKAGLVGTLKGVKDRNAAELLKGTQFFIDKSKLPEPDEEEFYYDQLTGLDVRDAAGTSLGTISAVYDFGAGDILEIRHTDGKKEMYPFTKVNFPQVRVQDGYVLAELPEIVEAKGRQDD
jgi:16S rRNA processing protein RimM